MAVSQFNTKASTGAQSGQDTTITVTHVTTDDVPFASIGTITKSEFSNMAVLSDIGDYDLIKINDFIEVLGTYYNILDKQTLVGPIYQVVLNGWGSAHTADIFTIHSPQLSVPISLQEVYNIDEIPIEKDPIDVSFHSNDPYANVIPNTYNPITWTLELNYIAEYYDIYKKWFDGYVEAGQTVSANSTLLGFEIVSGKNIKFLQQGKYTFNGCIVACSPTYAYGDRITHEIGVLVDGDMVHSTILNAAY